MISKARRRAPTSRLPELIGGAVALALVGALIAVVVHDAAEPATRPVPGPTVTATVVKIAAPKPEDPVSAAYRRVPLANLKKGNRVIYENGSRRTLCAFQEWGGSIDSATIKCGTRTLSVKTGFLTPVELITR